LLVRSSEEHVMTRGRFLTAVLVGAVAVASPAWAQRGKADAASRDPGTSVERTGTAVDRPSAGSSDAGSGSAGTVSSSPSTASTGFRAYEPVSPSGSAGDRFTAPVSPTERYERQQTRQRGEGGGERRPSGGASSDGARAVPRGSDSVTPSGGGRSRGASPSAGADNSPAGRAVPTYSRPRDGRPATGTAVDRRYPRPDGTGGYPGGYYTYFPSAYYSRYYLPGYAFGLGYYYDPLFYDPYLYGGGYGGYYGGSYGGSYAGASGRGAYGHGETGALRLKIKPRDAQVYVDGYFVGEVDQFDGIFQRLTIDAGSHHIEIRADGRKTIEFDVLIAPGETVTYKGELQ
jgi:hypothetical protein